MEFVGDAARFRRAGALGRDHRAAPAPALGLRLPRSAPAPPSGGTQATSAAEIQQGRPIQDLTDSWKLPVNNKAGLERVAAGDPDMQQT